MIILPAIDLLDGSCVRLYQGDYATRRRVAEDPLQTAMSFQEAGAAWLHVVDLNGAKEAVPYHMPLILELVRRTSLHVEVGGGIRSMETVDAYLKQGVARVILGSAALRDTAFVERAVQSWAERIAVGIDAKKGSVAADGWTAETDVDYIAFAQRMQKLGVQTFIFTDIARDGTLDGPNIPQLAALQASVCADVIASGGVKDLGHIKALRDCGVRGVICGRSIYDGTLSLTDALQAAKEA